jgi:hypothetical protein
MLKQRENYNLGFTWPNYPHLRILILFTKLPERILSIFILIVSILWKHFLRVDINKKNLILNFEL